MIVDTQSVPKILISTIDLNASVEKLAPEVALTTYFVFFVSLVMNLSCCLLIRFIMLKFLLQHVYLKLVCWKYFKIQSIMQSGNMILAYYCVVSIKMSFQTLVRKVELNKTL